MPETPLHTIPEAPLHTIPVPLLHSIADACQQLGGLSRTSLYRAIRAGQLTTVSAQGRTMVPHQSLVDFVDRAIAES